jgi:hypothetical protein
MLSTAIGNSAGPILNLDRDQIDDGFGENGDYIGQIKFLGRSTTGVQRNYAKITGKIGTATNGEEDGLIEVAAQNNGTMNPRARITGESLKLLNNTELEIEDYTDLEPPDETTGNSTAIDGYGTYTASASSNNGDAWQGFKGGSNWRSDTGKYNNGNAVNGQAASTTISSSATDGEWLQLELPYKVSLDSITIVRTGTQADRGPGRFKLAASNDGTTWTLVKDQSGSDITYTNDECEISSITPGPYKYYRLVVTKLAGSQASVQIKHLKLYGKITTSSKGGNTTIGGSASIAGECSIGALGSIFRSVRAIQVDVGNINSAEGDVTIPYGVTYPNVSKIIINATITSVDDPTVWSGPQNDVYACSIHTKTATNAKLRVQSLGGVTINANDDLKAEIVIFELP